MLCGSCFHLARYVSTWVLAQNPCNKQVLDSKPMGFGPETYENYRFLTPKPMIFDPKPCKMQVLDPNSIGFDPKPLKSAGFGP